jgi:uncharacterized circularly permuted ATP-grasp superfamily protein
VTGSSGVFAAYPASSADEAVGPDGELRAGYGLIAPALESLGPDGLARAARLIAAEREARGVVASSWVDGRPQVRPVGMDPLPRIVAAADWAALAAGVAQRHRALGAFLADAYRAAGRRRDDPDRDPEIVRAGVVPGWAVAAHPARDPDVVGLAWAGQARATVAGVDVVRAGDGRWTVLEDHLRVPAGLGHALANRRSARKGAAELFTRDADPVDPWTAVPALRGALADAAPPGCDGAPSVAVLSAAESRAAEFEPRLLAEALGVPVVHPADLWPRADGGVEASVDGRRTAVDVVYRWFDDVEVRVHRTPTGQSLRALLGEAVRAGRLSLVNVPGNAVADDRATLAWVPAMIRFYLGEEPLLTAPRTWVLADAAQWAQVRDRLHLLVIRPVGGYAGRGTVVGPACSAAELAQLQAEVAAAPHRFVAQEPVESCTVPALVEGALVPQSVELRVFSVADAGGGALALPAPLTRVSGASAPATKDTWLLP